MWFVLSFPFVVRFLFFIVRFSCKIYGKFTKYYHITDNLMKLGNGLKR